MLCGNEKWQREWRRLDERASSSDVRWRENSSEKMEDVQRWVGWIVTAKTWGDSKTWRKRGQIEWVSSLRDDSDELVSVPETGQPWAPSGWFCCSCCHGRSTGCYAADHCLAMANEHRCSRVRKPRISPPTASSERPPWKQSHWCPTDPVSMGKNSPIANSVTNRFSQ